MSLTLNDLTATINNNIPVAGAIGASLQVYSLVDTSFYGYKEAEVIKFFNRFRNACLTKDCILDKILELGINSLTEEDKKILEDEKNIHL